MDQDPDLAVPEKVRLGGVYSRVVEREERERGGGGGGGERV